MSDDAPADALTVEIPTPGELSPAPVVLDVDEPESAPRRTRAAHAPRTRKATAKRKKLARKKKGTPR